MKNKTDLSIVIPSYNQGKYIETTLNSILNQKTDLITVEVLIIDALSTDNTNNIVQKFIPHLEKKNIKVVYVREKDKGQADAINKGWKLAKGNIVSFLNSDDYYEFNSLQHVVSFFNKNTNIHWAYGGWNLVSANEKVYKSIQPKFYSRNNLLNYCNIGQPSCFFRKNLLSELGYLNDQLHLAMDYDLWLRFAHKYEAGIIPYVLSNMRYYKEAKSGNNTIAQQLEMLRLAKIYTKPLSIKRMWQYFYCLRGMLVYYLNKDITRRIEDFNLKTVQ